MTRQQPVRHVFACGYSRSGTTLLTTILDAHPDVAMGYEILPNPLPTLVESVRLLGEANDAPGRAEEWLRERDQPDLAKFVANARWSGVGARGVAHIARRMLESGASDLESVGDRAELAMAVADRKRRKLGATVSGFKANTPRLVTLRRRYPDSVFVFVVRDPRDVVASLRSRGSVTPVADITRSWRRFLTGFRLLRAMRPRQAVLVRYEDLVAEGEAQFQRIFAGLGLEVTDDVRQFWDSGATILGKRQNNAATVGVDLFTTSTRRWERDLDPVEAEEVARRCRRSMRRLGYSN